jgi:Stage II sporulation protein E (SpoIIE)
LTVSGMLEPARMTMAATRWTTRQRRVLHLGVFEAMGHGLAAAGVAAFALAAYRQAATCRRPTPRWTMRSVSSSPTVASSPRSSGNSTWSAGGWGGSARAILHRCSSAAGAAPGRSRLDHSRRSGSTFPTPTRGSGSNRSNRPICCWFYTDGLTEARTPGGGRLTLEGVSELIEHEPSAGQTAPETLRRIRHAILDGERAELRDDATALLVEWHRGAERTLMPQIVL